MAKTIVLIFLSCTAISAQVNDLLLNAQPSVIVFGVQESPSLSVVCSPTNPGIVTIFQMAVGTRNPDGSDNEIARISSSSPNTVSITDTSYGSRLKTVGSIGAGSKNLRIELTPIVCDDATVYYCKSVQLNSGGSVKQSEVTLTVTARKTPGAITMTASPHKTEYEIGSQVSFTCSGKLGNEINTANPQLDWRWEWRNDSTEMWVDYPAPENITYSRPTMVDNCTYIGSSSLEHTVTEEENGPQFRCLLVGKIEASTEIKIMPKPTPAAPVYPDCDEAELMAAISEMKSVANDSAGLCSNGKREKPEAVLMEFCNAPETKLWTSGPKVMDMCDTLPPQTPIALFQFGLYMDNNAGLAGIFMGCSDNGFTMATQICGHPVSLFHLDMKMSGVSEAENPNRYHVVMYNEPVTSNRPILVG